jgi:hypothetical protein
MIRRLSTATYARRAADHLENSAQLRAVLDLPMVTDILATLDGPRPQTCFILAAYQTFKSALGQFHLLRNTSLRPGPALWYCPTDPFSRDFADLKLNPLADSLPSIRALTYPQSNKTAKLRRNLAGGATILILSAHNENHRTGKTARDLLLDEAHLYQPGAIEQIRNRRGAYPESYLELFMSTGLTAGTDAAAEWLSTDRRVWHMRCANPSCHRLIEPRFAHHTDPTDPTRITGGLIYSRRELPDGTLDENHIAATLHHRCPHCGHTLPDHPSSRLALNGTAARPRGLYIITNPHARPHHHGWRTPALCVRDWLPIVLRFEKAHLARQRGDLEELARVVREEFADIWDPARYQNEKRLRPTGPYRMGEDWLDPETGATLEALDSQGRPYRIATIDVQQDHFVLVIRMWGENATSRLRWAEKITTPSRLADICNEHRVIPARTFLDVRHTPQYVRQLASRYGWRTLQGEPEKDYLHKELGLRRPYSAPRAIDPWLGTAHAGQSTILQIQFSKPSALERTHLLRTLETNDGQPLWTAAEDAPEWYFREIDAYHRIPKKTPKGEVYFDYAVHGPDHAADCEAMNTIAASMARLVGKESID